MTNAITCPVCQGKGKYEDASCHGCAKWGSLGWIVIDPEVIIEKVVVKENRVVYRKNPEPDIDGHVWHIDTTCPVCGRRVCMGKAPRAELEKPTEILLGCGDIVEITFEE